VQPFVIQERLHVNTLSLPRPKHAAWPHLLPGLALCLVLALVALWLGRLDWLAAHGFSALTVAIVLGIVVGNTVYPAIAEKSGAGVGFSKQTLLRTGVVLYGLRLTLQDIGHVGAGGVLIDALVLSSTFGLALLLGTRVLKLDRDTSMLIGAGSSICGAAAVMATEPVLRARAEKVTVAVSTVVVFGTIAIFLYPLLYSLSLHWVWLPQDANAFGIYAGSTIHEVAQVVAAGRSIGPAAADTAVIAKLVRVMMLAPFLIGLSAWLARVHPEGTNPATSPKRRIDVPWFAFMFVGVVAFNSFSLLSRDTVAHINDFDTLLLAMAMGALGLTTHVSSVRKAGLKPLLLAALLFGWLVCGGALINHGVTALLH
jgi:uncharacterized integral membrane protein (TIGR00698 family)